MHPFAIDEPARVEHVTSRVLPLPREQNSADQQRRFFFRANREFNVHLVAEAAWHEPQCLARGDIDALGAGKHVAHEWRELDHEIGSVTRRIVDQSLQAVAAPYPPRRTLAAANRTQDERN